MPSSTSSFSFPIPFRPIPGQPWTKVAVLMAVVVGIFFVGWEIFWRSQQYGQSYNDTPGLWSLWRDRLRGLENENPVVIVGDSRIRFDLDHERTRETFGGRPLVSLAMNGSIAPPVLRELAEDESFRGTVLCSYTPLLFWTPGGPQMESTIEWINYEKGETPSNRAGQYLAIGIESFFAFLNKTDLSLNALLRTIPLKNREGVQLPPKLPSYMGRVALDRREIMWDVLEEDTEFQQEIQNIWLGLLQFQQPIPPELHQKLEAEVVAHVRKIQNRGGEVIFIRFPSTDRYRELEEQFTPKAEFWIPLLEATGCLGIHFEDYPELAGYDCPEWSHLTSEDAVTFSRDLMRILEEERKQGSAVE